MKFSASHSRDERSNYAHSAVAGNASRKACGELKNTHRMEDQSEVEEFLASTAFCQPWGSDVERIDTHAAVVFLVGDRAYKIKRAVKYPYLDFSTLPRRHAACLHELEVNRRTAPALYLGVWAIRRRANGQLYIDRGDADQDPSAVVEWVIEMIRFDREKMLDRMVARHELNDALLKDLAEAIAAFHGSVDPLATGFDNAKSFRAIIHGNDLAFDEYQSLFPREQSLDLTAKSLAVVEAHASLFAERQERGKVRHCHGDLHLANIVIIDQKPVLFDAIEFDDRIATVDVFYDLAFLIMDLWERGCRREANVVFNRYLAITGDYSALPLLPLFLSVRASVRAKVSAAQGRSEEATTYFCHAVRFLTRVQPTCIAVGGLSGSGKSCLARALAPELGAAPGAIHLNSDVIRKELIGVAETQRLPRSAYSEWASAQVYEVLEKRARDILKLGCSVVVDAVFSVQAKRRSFETVASDMSIRPWCFWLSAPGDVLKSRVAVRRNDVSDATQKIVELQLGYNLGEVSWQRIESNAEPDILARRILDSVRNDHCGA
ncbi:bifunctional aminoglycoside phosphotransferase/ATP-binding protein [Pelagibius sp. Alg239-R121]|uniref:bifunctional aminoglycoside phosphotransferase/ATP-binding protein n=1 Tax=Pelagibius sp. Alg239-R121 TaxID=2993448 RepID=UPI0024A78133|nr:bifunctional aminoglycoside phosphotransferase/ATP-binding protein [Pelagibius sp. Alg239-R121]